MKIAIIVSAFPPNVLAGTEIATYNIAKYLAKRGHEVHVITLLDEGTQKKEIKEGFYVHRIKLHYKVPLISIIIYFKDVMTVIKKINPDVIHCQSLTMGWMAFIINIFIKYPYVIYGRGDDIYADYRLKKTLLGLVIKNADAVIALTEDMKNEISKIHKREIFVIPNGISLDKYGKKQSNDIHYSNGDKIILYVGRLHFIKGVKYLIEAMRIINKKLPNTKLLLIGDGKERKSLEKMVEEFGLNQCITFVGLVSNEDVPKYMAASDIFVLPSLSEGFPGVILEAMASGLPIVTTKIKGLPEIVCDGINGYLVNPKNPREIAEKIQYLVNNTEVMNRISKNNTRDIMQYKWENVVERLEAIYLTCI